MPASATTLCVQARRASPHGPGWEVLVKWTGLGYEHATWEVRGCAVACMHLSTFCGSCHVPGTALPRHPLL